MLLVDGDPSAISERSETHYLQSLNVPGTGLAMTDVTVSELETVSLADYQICLLYTSPSPRDRTRSRMPSSA